MPLASSCAHIAFVDLDMDPISFLAPTCPSSELSVSNICTGIVCDDTPQLDAHIGPLDPLSVHDGDLLEEKGRVSHTTSQCYPSYPRARHTTQDEYDLWFQALSFPLSQPLPFLFSFLFHLLYHARGQCPLTQKLPPHGSHTLIISTPFSPPFAPFVYLHFLYSEVAVTI